MIKHLFNMVICSMNYLWEKVFVGVRSKWVLPCVRSRLLLRLLTSVAYGCRACKAEMWGCVTVKNLSAFRG